MNEALDNWRTQIRKGYIELCVMSLIQKHKRLYGFELLDRLAEIGVSVKEGTLYPLLNRMTIDQTLNAVWETENLKGHPRKFYSLSKEGSKLLEGMREEFEKMADSFNQVKK